MASGWFESVAEAQRRARRRLPAGVYAALVALDGGIRRGGDVAKALSLVPPGFERRLGGGA